MVKRGQKRFRPSIKLILGTFLVFVLVFVLFGFVAFNNSNLSDNYLDVSDDETANSFNDVTNFFRQLVGLGEESSGGSDNSGSESGLGDSGSGDVSEDNEGEVLFSPVDCVSNNCYYVDFDGGSDSNSGTSPTSAWKHAPGDPNLGGNVRTSLNPGDIILFKGGVEYKGGLCWGTGLCGNGKVLSEGTEQNPIIVKGDAWPGLEGTKAIFDGSVDITGWTACSSQASCGNNPNWQNIYYASASGLTGEPGVYQDMLPVALAQNPNPLNAYYYDTGNYYTPSAVSSTTLRHPVIDSYTDGSLVGGYVFLWGNPNEIFVREITSHVGDQIVFASYLNYAAADTLFALAGRQLFLDSPGEFYFDSSAGRIYLYPYNGENPNSVRISTSVVGEGFMVGSTDYLHIEGIKFQKFGRAINQISGQVGWGVVVRDNEVTLTKGEQAAAINFKGDSTGLLVENNYVHDTGGTDRGIQSCSDNVIFRNNRLVNVARTGLFFCGGSNKYMINNTIVDSNGVHSNGISVYQGASNVLIADNTVINSNNAITLSSQGGYTNNVYIMNNIFDGADNIGYVTATWYPLSDNIFYLNNYFIRSNNDVAIDTLPDDGISNKVIINNVVDGGGDASDVDIGRYNLYTTASNPGRTGEFSETDLSKIMNDAYGRDYGIFATSSVVDAGEDLTSFINSYNLPALFPEYDFFTDIEGNPRGVGGGWDIGPYEFQGATTCTSDSQCPVDTACLHNYCNTGLGVCESAPINEGGSCADANVCNGAETCSSGTCVAGIPLVIDDGISCTTDSCDPVAGVSHVNNDAVCAVGGQCIESGTCEPTNPLANPTTGCIGVFSPVGTSCNDGADCTKSDQCDGLGVCSGTLETSCITGDGCCPAGCTEANDNDCGVSVSEGLIAYYPFDGNANDEIGSADGTVSGATLVAGQEGQAYSFDGGDSIALGSNPGGLTNGLSIAFWVKPTSINSGSIISGNFLNPFGLEYSSGDLRFHLRGSPSDDGSYWFYTNENFNTGEWYHVVLTYKPNERLFYVNGVLDATDSNPPTITDIANPSSVLIGSGFSGVIDEMRIYNRALSLSEIEQISSATPSVCGDGDDVCSLGQSQVCIDAVTYAGTQSCNSQCSGWNLCSATESCGDGIINGPEACDGSALGGETCVGLGYDSGTLGCLGTCNYDVSNCVGGNVITGVAFLGDSITDEYQGEPTPRGGSFSSVTFNYMELLTRERDLPTGVWGVNRPLPRRTGYEYNWALSGAVADDLSAQAPGVAGQVSSGEVSHVVIYIGANDWGSGVGVYGQIYSGGLSGSTLQNKINAYVADVTSAATTVYNADPGNVKILIMETPDEGLVPLIQELYDDPLLRQRFTDVANQINTALRNYASSRPGVETYNPNAYINEMVDRIEGDGRMHVGTGSVDVGIIMPPSTNNDPRYLVLGDNTHAGTVSNGLVANKLIVEPFNSLFGANLVPFTDNEILAIVGLYTPPTPVCGDNNVDSGEVCDGSDLNGQTCVSQGYDSGTLACASNCLSFVTSGCTTVQPCSLDSASWSATSVVEGTQVNLIVTGTNCDGEEISFEVEENDGYPFGGNDPVNVQPANVNFNGNSATGSWTSEYQNDGLIGDPEYIFRATLVSDPGVSVDSSNELSVSQAPPTQCSDGIDNDGDSLVDYPNDPGCVNADDDSEDDSGVQIVNGKWMTLDGEKFFPIYVWTMPPSQTWVDYTKGLGINTYMGNGWAVPDLELLDMMQANDMHGIVSFDSALIGHPALIGWLHPDEPDIHGTSPSTVISHYNNIKSQDSSTPVVLNTGGRHYRDENFELAPESGDWNDYVEWRDALEISSFDFYPVTGWDRPDYVYIPGKATESMRIDYGYEAADKPVWFIAEASDQDLAWTPPETVGPNPAELRFEVFDSIIHGATGIGYFTIAFNPFRYENIPADVEAEMARTNGQITALTEVILSDAPAISVNAVEASGRDFNYMVRQSGSTYYLFVSNADMPRRTESITFTFPQNIASVSVYGEGRSVTPSGSSFTDSFSALDVQIYEVVLGGVVPDCVDAGDCAAAGECQSVSCVSGSCVYDNLADGTACLDDGLFCTGLETCSSGSCVSAGDPCVLPATCNEVSNQCESCAPNTCSGLGYECGSWDDGCGGSLSCGTCSGSDICVSGSCQAPASGLIAYYPFDSNFNDLSGNLHNGVAVGNAVITNDATRGQVLSLDGNGDYVRVSDADDLDLVGTPFTLASWINPVADSSFNSIITKNGFNSGYQLYLGNNVGEQVGYSFNGFNDNVGPTISTATWTHLAMVFNGNSIIFYKNGVASSSIPKSGLLATDLDLLIGAFYNPSTSGYGDYFNGKIDDVRIYNRALSQAEIQAIMSGVSGPVCGDGNVEGSEVCEIGNSQACVVGGYDGTQSCNSQCSGWNTCVATESCGDDLINGPELCDGIALGGESCQTQGFDSGTLACASNCLSFVTSGCVNLPTCTDSDGDGYNVSLTGCGVADCNDGNPNIHPGATEVCNGVDDNCLGGVDEGACSTINYYCDGDSDGYRSSSVSGSCSSFNCVPASCSQSVGTDCNDGNAAINPGALDSNCNAVDENCNGVNDDGYVSSATGCGVGNCAGNVGTLSCINGAEIDSCNPFEGAVPESCSDDTGYDGEDNNCDGTIDLNCDGFCDDDGDGYTSNIICVLGGFSLGECDDSNAAINPGATEIPCNGVDENCDSGDDLGTDLDGDGYTLEGGLCGAIDCDDSDNERSPGLSEVCDGKDNNCDSNVDESNGDCSGGLPYCVSGSCVECVSDGECSDGLFCNGAEVCSGGSCVDAADVDCSGNNLPGVAQCDYVPDGIPTTRDFFAGFTSLCNEASDSCTTGVENVVSSCIEGQCGAECDADVDCDCSSDVCEDREGDGLPNDYVDYPEFGSCDSECGCDVNACVETVSYNDPRCPSCDSDDDCDDGLFCNGEETCNLGTGYCQTGTNVDCSGNNILPVESCTNIPDGISTTWDSFVGFDSICNEASDSCTTGVENVVSSCIEGQCGAECNEGSDCADVLVGDECNYNGDCNPQCGCDYSTEYCPTPGTSRVEGFSNVCYYGTQSCGSSGCGLQTCVMNSDFEEVCDAVEGCLLDVDGDGLANDVDNCVFVSNPGQEDEDSDGVGDSCDLCPGTRSHPQKEVGVNGCLLPKSGKFKGKTTDFNNINTDLNELSGLVLEAESEGAIIYIDESFNVEDVDFDSNVDISNGTISVNSTNLTFMNTTVKLWFYNVNYTEPALLKDGLPCTDCESVSYNSTSQIYIAEVPGFTSYTVYEGYVAPSCGDGVCNGEESCSTCSGDCGACDTGGSTSGGSSGGGSSGGGSACSPDWDCSDWSYCIDGIRTRDCNDASNCGTESGKPSEEESCSCSEEWVCDQWGECNLESLLYARDCIDSNNCGTQEFLPPLEKICDDVPVYGRHYWGYFGIGVVVLGVIILLVLFVRSRYGRNPYSIVQKKTLSENSFKGQLDG